MTQLGEHKLLKWDEHVREVQSLIQEIEHSNENLVISLHPKMDQEFYNSLLADYKCVVVKERLFKILPVADLFVGMNTSTHIWGLICGVKAILLDFHGLDYGFLRNFQSLHIVKSKSD